jgi:hypothetical protein
VCFFVCAQGLREDWTRHSLLWTEPLRYNGDSATKGRRCSKPDWKAYGELKASEQQGLAPKELQRGSRQFERLRVLHPKRHSK